MVCTVAITVGTHGVRPGVDADVLLVCQRHTISVTPHAMWGGNAPYRQPRHTDWKIEPDGGYAAEERAVSFLLGTNTWQ